MKNTYIDYSNSRSILLERFLGLPGSLPCLYCLLNMLQTRSIQLETRAHFFHMESTVTSRADKYSNVSTAYVVAKLETH